MNQDFDFNVISGRRKLLSAEKRIARKRDLTNNFEHFVAFQDYTPVTPPYSSTSCNELSNKKRLMCEALCINEGNRCMAFSISPESNRCDLYTSVHRLEKKVSTATYVKGSKVTAAECSGFLSSEKQNE